MFHSARPAAGGPAELAEKPGVFMHLDFTDEQLGLRRQIRGYYEKLCTPDLRAAFDAEWDEGGGPGFRRIGGAMGFAERMPAGD